jgi:hypothetical protein
MNTDAWLAEVSRYCSMPSSDRWRWLAKLAFLLTILARDTYIVGGTGLADPIRMRRFNELAHRVSGQLKSKAAGQEGIPDQEFGTMVGAELRALGVSLASLVSQLM